MTALGSDPRPVFPEPARLALQDLAAHREPFDALAARLKATSASVPLAARSREVGVATETDAPDEGERCWDDGRALVRSAAGDGDVPRTMTDGGVR